MVKDQRAEGERRDNRMSTALLQFHPQIVRVGRGACDIEFGVK